MGRAGVAGHRVVDMRLVPAALAGWSVTLVGLYVGWPAAAACGLAGLAAVGLGLAGRATALRGVLLATGGVVVAVALTVGMHGWQAQRNPLHGAAAGGAAATVEAEVREDPRPIQTSGYGGRPAAAGRVVVSAELTSATVAGRRYAVGGRVVLLADADGWTGLLPGQRVRAHGLLAMPDRTDLTVAVLRVRGPAEVLSEPTGVQRVAERLRAGLRTAAARLDPESAGLLPSLVVGDTSAMVPAVVRDFRAAGLAHLTAVSGTNVAILCGAVLGLARLARAGPRTAAVLAAVALVGFVVLCRPQPSVLRAAVMGGVTLLALLLGRERSAVPALATAVIGLLLYDPGLAVDPGFALSVLATGGLILLAPGWAAALRRRGVPGGLAEALTIPAAACVVTAPIVATLSGHVSLVSVPANLLAAPAVAPATVLGALVIVVEPVAPPVAAALVRVAGVPTDWLVAVGRHAASVPGGVLGWPGGARGGLLLAALALVALLILRGRRIRALTAAILVGLLLVVVPTRYSTPGWPSRSWAVVACDVGQGDAVVLATARRDAAVLVDVGPDTGPANACLDRLGVDRVAMVILSHLHADHIGGLAGVLRQREVAAVALGPGRTPSWAFRDVLDATTAAGVPLVGLRAGQGLSWPGLRLDVLAPVHAPPPVSDEAAEVDGTEVNNASLVLRAATPAGRVLLTGDVELDAQAELLAAGVDLRADVLKVPHHGSRYTSEEFLDAVRPRVALVSVGADNQYGHPSGVVLGALHRAGTRVLRTDRAGDVAVVGSPGRLSVLARGDPLPARP